MAFDIDEPFLSAAEEQLGARFPLSYRMRMKRGNGGTIEAAGEHWELYPIADTSNRKRLAWSTDHVVRETWQRQRMPRFPNNAVTIAHNAAGDQLVLLKAGQAFADAVFLWQQETAQLSQIADDFADL